MLDLAPDERKQFRLNDPYGYEHFWGLVVQLDDKLVRDDSNERLWGRKHPENESIRRTNRKP